MLRLLILITSVFFSFAAHAFKTDKIIIFGDSLSDNGNLYSLTLHLIPKSSVYYKGHFTNGRVWAEELAVNLNLNPDDINQFVDYAYGGAWAEPFYDSHSLVVPGLGSQLSKYIKYAKNDRHIADHLFIIWCGGNDYLAGRSNIHYATTNTVNHIFEQVDVLIGLGAKQILLLNLPDLGKTPYAINHDDKSHSSHLSLLTQLHNQKLLQKIIDGDVERSLAQIYYFDVYAYFNDAIQHPEKYGITHTKEACYPGSYLPWGRIENNDELYTLNKMHINVLNEVDLREAYINGLSSATPCDTPDKYVYWDRVHPTTKVAKVLAQAVALSLE